MMKSISFILLLPLMAASPVLSADVEVMDFPSFQREYESWDEGIYVVNFWATWCMPCVKELPYFEMIGKKYEGEDVHIILVSLNFESEIESKVKPFIDRYGIASRVILLNDTDYNSWIDKISPEWSGSIPATLVLKPSENYTMLYEQSLEYNQLENIILNLK